MSRRIDNECAWCAEKIQAERECIGADWKVYCSITCRTSGEQNSRTEWLRLMQHSTPGRGNVSSPK